MSITFPLTEAGWIPVSDSAGHRAVGIREALTRAHEVRLDVMPGHEHAVLLRLLLAVYDAAAGPATIQEWATAWQAPALDIDRVTAYLDAWGERLDLFHPQRPAFQAGGLTKFPRGHKVLRPAYLGGQAGEWFANGELNSPEPVPAAEAARHLLVRLAYDVAGIKGGIGGGRTFGAWLGRLGAVTHTSFAAPTLKDELLLNLPPAARAPGDRPVWEQDDLPLTPGAQRPVAGRLDWWTWPSRLMRLQPDGDGRVAAVAWHDGLRPDSSLYEAAQAHDPLTAWAEPGKRIHPGDEYGYLPAWYGGRVVLTDTAVMRHVVQAAEKGVLPAGYPLRLTAAWTQYNVHKVVIEDERGDTVSLGPAGLLADVETRHRLAAAADFAQRVPRVIRGRLSAEGEPELGKVGPLVLPDLHGPWKTLLEGLHAGRGEGAVRAWRETVTEETEQLAEREVRTRSSLDKARMLQRIRSYLTAIPVDSHPGQPCQARGNRKKTASARQAVEPAPRSALQEPAQETPETPAGRSAVRSPLAGVRNQIDPEVIYTVRTLAELLQCAETSVRSMATYGWLPGARISSHRRGGRQYEWDGRTLLQLADQELQVEYDHQRFAPQTLYRIGCRCDSCTNAHGEESVRWRREWAEELFPEAARMRLLKLVERGMPVAQAAAEVGTTPGRVYGRTAWDTEFAEALNWASRALCVLGKDDPRCGSAAGYRGSTSQPQGGESPVRPPCRGTACRTWRREQSRRERGGAARQA